MYHALKFRVDTPGVAHTFSSPSALSLLILILGAPALPTPTLVMHYNRYFVAASLD